MSVPGRPCHGNREPAGVAKGWCSRERLPSRLISGFAGRTRTTRAYVRDVHSSLPIPASGRPPAATCREVVTSSSGLRAIRAPSYGGAAATLSRLRRRPVEQVTWRLTAQATSAAPALLCRILDRRVRGRAVRKHWLSKRSIALKRQLAGLLAAVLAGGCGGKPAPGDAAGPSPQPATVTEPTAASVQPADNVGFDQSARTAGHRLPRQQPECCDGQFGDRRDDGTRDRQTHLGNPPRKVTWSAPRPAISMRNGSRGDLRVCEVSRPGRTRLGRRLCSQQSQVAERDRSAVVVRQPRRSRWLPGSRRVRNRRAVTGTALPALRWRWRCRRSDRQDAPAAVQAERR